MSPDPTEAPPAYVLRPMVRVEALVYAPFIPDLLGVTHVAKSTRGITEYWAAEHNLHHGRLPPTVALVNYTDRPGRARRQTIYIPLRGAAVLAPLYRSPREWLGIELPAPGLVYVDLLGGMYKTITRRGDLFSFSYLDDRPPRLAPDIELMTVAIPVALVVDWLITPE